MNAGWVLVACLALACASAPPTRLADGSTVPAGAQYVAPVPRDAAPNQLLGQLGSGGVRGTFRAEVLVSAVGTVTDVRIVESVDSQADELLVASLQRLTFTPASLDGVAIAAVYPVRYDFTTRN